MKAWLVAVLTVAAVGVSVDGFQPRRILFGRCSSEEIKPRAVFMTCANRRGVCEVRKGGSHTLQAIFIPEFNATEVESYVRWNTGWVELPLPGQDEEPCGDEMICPVVAGRPTYFTYMLDIQNFWPDDEFPVIWSLSDKESGETLVCFKFRISIV